MKFFRSNWCNSDKDSKPSLQARLGANGLMLYKSQCHIGLDMGHYEEKQVSDGIFQRKSTHGIVLLIYGIYLCSLVLSGCSQTSGAKFHAVSPPKSWCRLFVLQNIMMSVISCPWASLMELCFNHPVDSSGLKHGLFHHEDATPLSSPPTNGTLPNYVGWFWMTTRVCVAKCLGNVGQPLDFGKQQWYHNIAPERQPDILHSIEAIPL